MLKFIKRIKNAIWWRIGPSDWAKVKRLKKRPPAIKDNAMVFTSSADYTGNPKALFLYMIDHGYNEHYEITWLFEFKENIIDFGLPNVKSALIWNDKGEPTAEAQKAIMSARYIFYSHNVNWARVFRPEQTFINLWHGSGYKAAMPNEKKKIYFDYIITAAPMHNEPIRVFLKAPEGNVIVTGLPVNDFFKTDKSNARNLLQDLKNKAGADKAIVWMPTYRKSRLERTSTDIAIGDTGIPILYDQNSLEAFNDYCRDHKILVILKRHQLQSVYPIEEIRLSNLLFIDDKYLRDNDAEMYEMLAASDALISDYSGVAVDYILLDKPLAYTLDDFDRYDEARGFSFENVKEYMPGHHVYTLDELEQFVSDIAEGRDLHREWRHKVLPMLHTYTEDFSKRVLEYFGL